MTSPFRATRAAFCFLTRIPVGGYPYTPEEWRGSTGYFPVVGAALGAATAGVFACLGPIGTTGAAYLALAASLLLTGAFHEDGLADTSDALGGGYDPEKVFAILKDSRVGAFGACALVVSIGGRAALLAHSEGRALAGLVLVGAAARGAAVWQMAALPYVTTGTAKSAHVARAGGPQVAIASGVLIVVGAALVLLHRLEPARVTAVFLATAAVAGITAWRYKARAGGVTGDFLGATEQLCELAGLAVIAWSAP